jgi:hypothetical protein
MIEWIALLLFLIVAGWTLRESFEDLEYKSTTEGSAKFGVAGVGVAKGVTRPSLESAEWKSKIDVQVPIGSNDKDYIKALQAFYDKVYEPAPTKPTVADIEKFLAGPDVTGLPVDNGALRKIISNGFRIEPGTTAAAREEQQVKFSPSKAIEPSDGRDEVRTRAEEDYRPSDTRMGELPEGRYAPVEQQLKPRRPGEKDYGTTGKTSTQFYDVCVETNKPGCEENVL